VYFWDSKTADLSLSTFKSHDINHISWAKKSHNLVLSTLSGEVIIYSQHERKTIHKTSVSNSSIQCLAWNSEDFLAISDKNAELTIINTSGDQIFQSTLEFPPLKMEFSDSPHNLVIQLTKQLFLFSMYGNRMIP
jgi:WD40 repeat protein